VLLAERIITQIITSSDPGTPISYRTYILLRHRPHVESN